jgi:hypothetical protein
MLQCIKSSDKGSDPSNHTRKNGSAMIYLCKQHAAWVLDVLLDFHQERSCFPAIDEAMIVRKSQIHHLVSS